MTISGAFLLVGFIWSAIALIASCGGTLFGWSVWASEDNKATNNHNDNDYTRDAHRIKALTARKWAVRSNFALIFVVPAFVILYVALITNGING